MDPRLAVSLRQIGRLEELLRKLSEVPHKIAADAAPEINRLVQQQFEDGKDPYGKPWAPLKRSTLQKGRRPPPLTDTRQLRNNTRVYPYRNSLRVVIGMPYGYFHQVGTRRMVARGTRRMVARRILPQAGMPKAWSEALKASFRKLAKGVR